MPRINTTDLDKSALTKALLKAIIRQWEKTASFEDLTAYLQEKWRSCFWQPTTSN